MQSLLILIADSNGGYPVPATKGGAVSTLVEHLVRENNDKQRVDLTIMSFYDLDAENKAMLYYQNVNFVWVSRPVLVRAIDWLVLNVVKVLFPGKKLLSFMSIGSLLWYIWNASRLLKKKSYEKVVLENNIPLAWAIKLSGYQGDYYYHLHNTPRTNAGRKDVLEGCRGFLCVSRSVGNDICNQMNPIGPVPYDKIKVVYNCVDTNHFCQKKVDRQSFSQRFGIKEDDRIVAFVGRLSEEKGIDQLLLSLDYVKTKNLKVLIVGSLMYNNNMKDTYQKKLTKLANRHSNMIIFTGYISQQELPDIYNFADISVLPSMWDEPAGLTMIESLVCGTPVITTRSGGIPEYVEGGAILLDRSENLPQDIANSIDLLLSDDEIYQSYSKTGMEKIKKNFSTELYLEKFLTGIK